MPDIKKRVIVGCKKKTLLHSKKFRVLIALLLIISGVVFVERAQPLDLVTALLSGLGLALIVAGLVSFLRIALIMDLELDEIGSSVSEKIYTHLVYPPPKEVGQHKSIAAKIVNGVVDELREGLPGFGLRRIALRRQDDPRYISWAKSEGAQDLAVVGRSVLPSLDRNLRQCGLGSAEDELIKALERGSNVRILFLDPRSSLIESIRSHCRRRRPCCRAHRDLYVLFAWYLPKTLLKDGES